MEKSARAKNGCKTFGAFYLEDISCIRSIHQSSLTIPGQSRDLGSLLAASKFSGGMIPRHGTPEYDVDEAHALARLRLEALDDEQVAEMVQAQHTSSEVPPDGKEEESPHDDAQDGGNQS